MYKTLTVNEIPIARTPFIAMQLELYVRDQLLFTVTFLWQSGSVTHAVTSVHLCMHYVHANQQGTCSDRCQRHSGWFWGRNSINTCGIKSYKNLFRGIFGYHVVSAQTQAWPTQSYDRKLKVPRDTVTSLEFEFKPLQSILYLPK